MLSLKINSSSENYLFGGKIKLFDLINRIQKDNLEIVFSICCNDYTNNNFIFINFNNNIYMFNPKMKWCEAKKNNFK